MRVLTLNIWKNEGEFPGRLKLVRKGLLDLDPDIVCLQEVYQDEHFNALPQIGTPALPHRTIATAREKLRDGVMSSSGLAILSRYPIAAFAIKDLPTSVRDGGRVVLRADIKTPGGPIRVISLHLTHLYGEDSRALRAAQWDASVAFGQEDWDGPLLMCGDFNDLVSADWLQASLLTHKAQCSGTMIDAPSSLRGHPSALIDHIVLIAGGGLELAHCAMALEGEPIASDHLAIVGELVGENKSTVNP
jgi:endonuclease/exonuclease/phosphatase family metal-dependent hydrolase